MKSTLLVLGTVALLSTPLASWCTDTPTTVNASADTMTDGEVRKIDLANAKITLRHGEIKSLDMPAMTMVFQVRDKRLLEGLKVGDKLRFKAVHEGSQLVVTEVQAAR